MRSVVFGKVANKAADARCNDRMDACGCRLESDWGEVGVVCTYNGRDYRPTGDETRVGLTDLFTT